MGEHGMLRESDVLGTKLILKYFIFEDSNSKIFFPFTIQIKMNISWSKLLVLVLVAYAAYSIKLQEAHDVEHEFCWKDTYGRGAGSVPTECGERAKIGLLCYSHCKPGWYRFGLDCYTSCPNEAGWRDDGFFCRRFEYGRGGGYPWRWFETNDNGRLDRCRDDGHPQGCEMYWGMAYPRCNPGYYPFECCICRPHVPNCAAYGLNPGVDLSCGKKIEVGDPEPMGCPAHLDYDGALCYPKCRSGFYGVGPVCWSHAPSGWVDCAMGAAKDTKVCAETIVGQIAAVGEMALSIAGMVGSMGTSAAATAGAKVAANAGKISKIKALMDKIKTAIKSNEKIKKLVDKAKEIKNKVEKVTDKIDKIKEKYEQANDIIETSEKVVTEDYSNYTPADYARLAASVAALADPTGIAGVIENFSHPICSQIFKS